MIISPKNKKMIKFKKVKGFIPLIGFVFMLGLSSCWVVRSGSIALSIASILKGAGERLIASSLAQAAKDLIDVGWNYLSGNNDGSGVAEDPFKDVVEPLSNVLSGKSIHDLTIEVSADANGRIASGSVTIPKSFLSFERFRETSPWFPSTQTLKKIDTHTRTLTGQACLTVLGYEPGLIDGIPGRITRAALRRFQSDEGLLVTEVLDDSTYQALMNYAKISQANTF